MRELDKDRYKYKNKDKYKVKYKRRHKQGFGPCLANEAARGNKTLLTSGFSTFLAVNCIFVLLILFETFEKHTQILDFP